MTDSFYLHSTHVSANYDNESADKIVVRESDLACINALVQDTHWSIGANPDPRANICIFGYCDHVANVEKSDNVWIGDGDLTSAGLYRESRFVPLHIRSIRALVGDSFVRLTPDIANAIKHALDLDDDFPLTDDEDFPLFEHTVTSNDKDVIAFLQRNMSNDIFIRVTQEN